MNVQGLLPGVGDKNSDRRTGLTDDGPMGSPRGVPVPCTAMPAMRSGSSSAVCRVSKMSSL